jgi:hypothetical protein
MWSLMESVTHETRDHIKSEGKLAMDAKSLSASTVDAEIAHLRQQNALLTQLLESERSQGERARDELVRQVSGLLGEFTAARDRGLRKVVEEVQRANDDGEKRMAEFGEMHGSRMDGIVGRGVDFSKVLERKGKEGKKATAATSKVRLPCSIGTRIAHLFLQAASAAQSNFAGHLSQLQGSISGSLTSHVGEVQSQIQTMVTTSTNGECVGVALDWFLMHDCCSIRASRPRQTGSCRGYQCDGRRHTVRLPLSTRWTCLHSQEPRGNRRAGHVRSKSYRCPLVSILPIRPPVELKFVHNDGLVSQSDLCASLLH